jgi:hypothetical protein
MLAAMLPAVMFAAMCGAGFSEGVARIGYDDVL